MLQSRGKVKKEKYQRKAESLTDRYGRTAVSQACKIETVYYRVMPFNTHLATLPFVSSLLIVESFPTPQTAPYPAREYCRTCTGKPDQEIRRDTNDRGVRRIEPVLIGQFMRRRGERQSQEQRDMRGEGVLIS